MATAFSGINHCIELEDGRYKILSHFERTNVAELSRKFTGYSGYGASGLGIEELTKILDAINNDGELEPAAYYGCIPRKDFDKYFNFLLKNIPDVPKEKRTREIVREIKAACEPPDVVAYHFYHS